MSRQIRHIAPAVFALALLTNLGSQEPNANSGELLTVEDVIRMVEASNLQVLLSREGIEEARQIYEQRKAALYPQLDLNLQQGRNQFVNVGRGFDIPGVDLSAPPANRFDGTLQGSVSLLSTRKFSNWKLARLGVEISELDHETLYQDVLEIAISAYITHVRNLAGLDVIDANIRRNQALLDLATDRFNAGVATQIDVTRAEVNLANAQQARLQQETQVLNSELQLKRILNLDLDTPIKVEELSDRVGSVPRVPVGMTTEAVLERRSEYQAALRIQDQNRLARKAAAWQRIPDVELFGNYGYATEVFLDGDEQETWGVGVRLVVPIFEGFRIQAEKRQADSRIRAQDLVIEQLEDQVDSNLRFLRKDVQSRFDQIAVAKKAMDLRREEVDLATTRFEQGVADNTEVVDAQNNLAESEDNLVEAYFQYALARLSLVRELGDVRRVTDF